jgi:hypothetical protein
VGEKISKIIMEEKGSFSSTFSISARRRIVHSSKPANEGKCIRDKVQWILLKRHILQTSIRFDSWLFCAVSSACDGHMSDYVCSCRSSLMEEKNKYI